MIGMCILWCHRGHKQSCTRTQNHDTCWHFMGLTWQYSLVFGHYINMILFVLETGVYRVSGSFDLLTKLFYPMLNSVQHVEAIYTKSPEVSVALPEKRRYHLRKLIMKSLVTLKSQKQPPQGWPRGVMCPSSNERPEQHRTLQPQKKSINLHVLAMKPHMHLSSTRVNIPRTMAPINGTENLNWPK